MKISITNLCLMFFLLMAMACGQKTEKSATDSSSDEWPAMDTFHMIMAEAYHPYKDSSNLAPVKKIAEEMAQNAAAWQGAQLPEKVNNDEMKTLLTQLASDTRALADQIKSGAPDAEIGTSLTALHDGFHKITEAWNGSEEKHEH